MKNTHYQVLTVKHSEVTEVLKQYGPLTGYEYINNDGQSLVSFAIGGLSHIALHYASIVDKFKLTEDQIENNRLFDDYHTKDSFTLQELRSIPGIIENDLTFSESCDFRINANNCEIIKQVSYRTNDQDHIKYDSLYQSEYKRQILEKSENHRSKFFYIQKYHLDQLLDESKNIANILDLADREGIQRLNVAHSGRYYLKKEDGWYLTSDTDTCDQEHGLPPEGRKIN